MLADIQPSGSNLTNNERDKLENPLLSNSRGYVQWDEVVIYKGEELVIHKGRGWP